jgi:predicted transcriptional regulator
MSKKINLRKKRILKDIEEGKLSYKEIGGIYGLTKQRIQQYAKENNIYRWKESKSTKKQLMEDVKQSIIEGLSYQEIVNKHSYKKRPITYVLDFNLRELYKQKRDKEILNLYKTMSAKEILNIPVSALDTPYRVKRINTVYSIVGKQGYRKYSKVGHRYKGGCFEYKKVINIIKKLRGEGVSYRLISERLNKKGIKTIQGKEYTTHNVQRIYSVTNKK